MATSPVLPKLVGQRVKRREDPRLIQGRGTYVDDVKIAGMQTSRSSGATSRTAASRSIDTSAAAAMRRGSRLHRRRHREVREARADRDAVSLARASGGGHRHRALRRRARGGGGRADRYLARDAADAIRVDYDPLPVVVDPERAMTGQPAVIHPASRTTWPWRWCPAAPASARTASPWTIRPSRRPSPTRKSSSPSG